MSERKMQPGLQQQRLDGEAGNALLTVKQARFALEYAKDGNATKAAERAGYSASTAREMGYENLTKPHINAAVSVALERHLGDLDLSVERIIQEAARVGVSDVRQLFDPETKAMLSPADMPENIVRAIGSIKVTEVVAASIGSAKVFKRTTEVKLWDKLKGLELIAKLKGLLTPEVKVEAGESWKEVLQQMQAEKLPADTPAADSE